MSDKLTPLFACLTQLDHMIVQYRKRVYEGEYVNQFGGSLKYHH